ncbi:MAG: hypothetical protein RLZZ184_3661 [Cyanobacteriota bacterium]|jgi:hypothetical protein
MVIFALLQISHVGWVKRQRNPTKDIMKMSESGYPGFKDLQDEGIKYLLSESGYPGFKDLQDNV